MKKNKGLFAAGAVVVVVLVIGVIAMAMGGKDDSMKSSSTMGDSGSMQMGMSSDSSGDMPSASNAVATDKVTIKDYKYGPAAITVKVGTTVTWTNTDSVSHDVYPDSPSDAFKTGKLFAKGESYSYTFTKAGKYTYHCTPHPYMHGMVVVTE